MPQDVSSKTVCLHEQRQQEQQKPYPDPASEAARARAAGAVYADYSNLTVLESAFLNNAGSDGGAITAWNSSLLVNGTTFTNNSAGGTGERCF